MVVSTGIGGGIVLEGRLFHGADSNAGHIGDIRIVNVFGNQRSRMTLCLRLWILFH